MTLALAVFKKHLKNKQIPLNALGSKFDLEVKYVKVNLGSLFEQTWKDPHPQCKIQSSKVTCLLVLEKNILKGFNHIWAWRPSWSCDLNVLHFD